MPHANVGGGTRSLTPAEAAAKQRKDKSVVKPGESAIKYRLLKAQFDKGYSSKGTA
tara:strand:+ start:293 stop:460 length:168 start_codon:yes stop_codon:yes gene_type:complete